MKIRLILLHTCAATILVNCQPTRMTNSQVTALRTTITLIGDSIPREWVGTDTVYVNYSKAKSNIYSVDGGIKIYPKSDSLVAEWFTYRYPYPDFPIDLLLMKYYYAASRGSWVRTYRMASPRTQVLDRLNTYFYRLSSFKSPQVYHVIDTYLLTKFRSNPATLIIDHSTELNVSTQLRQLFIP